MPPSEPLHRVTPPRSARPGGVSLQGPVFRKVYIPNPLLIGYFSNRNTKFVGVCLLFPCCSSVRSPTTWHILHCRNDRVLVHRTDAQLSSEGCTFDVPSPLLIWNPITGDQKMLLLPLRDYQFFVGVILCVSPKCNYVHSASGIAGHVCGLRQGQRGPKHHMGGQLLFRNVE